MKVGTRVKIMRPLKSYKGESSKNPLRTAAVRVFRMFSKGENPTMEEGLLAVKYLSRQTGHGEDEAMTFFGDCYTWFRDKEKTFSTAEDEVVIAMVVNRFKTWMEDERKRTEPTTARHWRAEPLEKDNEKNTTPPVLRPEQLPEEKFEEVAVDYAGLKHASKEEIADDTRLTKETDFARFLQRLKARQDIEGRLLVLYICETLRENAKLSRADLALDKAVREQAMKRNPQIRSLIFNKTIFKKTHLKK